MLLGLVFKISVFFARWKWSYSREVRKIPTWHGPIYFTGSKFRGELLNFQTYTDFNNSLYLKNLNALQLRLHFVIL